MLAFPAPLSRPSPVEGEGVAAKPAAEGLPERVCTQCNIQHDTPSLAGEGASNGCYLD
jgi:hypothetical protein